MKKKYIRETFKEKEVAEEFGRCLAKVVGRKKPYKPYWDKKLKQWVIEGGNEQLYDFLNRPLEELKPYIEYSKETVASFLRGVFDRSGDVNEKGIVLYGSKELLEYVRYLLKKYFDIDTESIKKAM
ncbi:MAG: hypothetical protein QW272_09765 [Candidatus Methanomethylicaceae archaeon]